MHFAWVGTEGRRGTSYMGILQWAGYGRRYCLETNMGKQKVCYARQL